MFLKNGFRPAYAGVTPTDKHNGPATSRKTESMAFSSSETDDFNSFSSRSSSRRSSAPKNRPSNSNRPKKPSKKKRK